MLFGWSSDVEIFMIGPISSTMRTQIIDQVKSLYTIQSAKHETNARQIHQYEVQQKCNSNGAFSLTNQSISTKMIKKIQIAFSLISIIFFCSLRTVFVHVCVTNANTYTFAGGKHKTVICHTWFHSKYHPLNLLLNIYTSSSLSSSCLSLSLKYTIWISIHILVDLYISYACEMVMICVYV